MTSKKFQLYLSKLPQAQDKDGFIEWSHCDSTLFSGLLGSIKGIQVNLLAARSNEGQWFRRSLKQPACFPNHSKSTISRDMLLGVAWWAWANKRLDVIEGVIKYAFSHWFMMGDAVDFKTKWGRCLISPSLLSLYCRLSRALGGPNRWWITWIPVDVGPPQKGFTAHLQVLSILLNFLATKKASAHELKIINTLRQRDDYNALFAATHFLMTGSSPSYQHAMKLLRNPNWFPKDRLPLSSDRKTSWLWQRQWGDDYRPSSSVPAIQHHGGDYLFVYALLNEMIGE